MFVCKGTIGTHGCAVFVEMCSVSLFYTVSSGLGLVPVVSLLGGDVG